MSGEVPAVRMAGVRFSYHPGLLALDAIDLVVPQGTRLGIFGPNGGGKSTLLRLILGLIAPDDGRIEVFGMSPRDAVREGVVGYLAQRHGAELQAPLSVRQVVGLSAALRLPAWRTAKGEIADRVQHVMDLAGIADLADRPVGDLSGGQQQRVFIARALAGSPRLLVLDEPTVGIDRAGRELFVRMLEEAHAALGLTLIVVSHNLGAIASGCDQIAVLSRTLHYHAAPAGLTPAVLTEVFHHDIAVWDDGDTA